MEWIEKQIGRLINFFVDAKEDLNQFDTKIQNKIAEYRNKQCGKAAIFGIVIGVIGTVAVEKIIQAL